MTGVTTVTCPTVGLMPLMPLMPPMPPMPPMVAVRVVGVINPLFCVVSMLTVLIWAAVVVIGVVRHVGAVVLVVAHGHAPIAHLSWSESVPRVGFLAVGFVLAGDYAAV